MAAFAGTDLKKWREMQGISAADLAELINCDTSTIHRYEKGTLKPNPDVMYQICDALGDYDRWCDWMRTEYPTSYNLVHPDSPKYNLSGALMSLYAEMGDMLDLQRDALRDAADGKFNTPEIEERLRKELTDLVSRAQLLLNIMRSTRK